MTTPYKTTPATSGFTLAPGEEWTSKAAQWPLVMVTRETEPGHWLTHVVPVHECFVDCDTDCESGPRHCLWIHEPNHKQGWHSRQDCPGRPLPQAHLCCAVCDDQPSVFCLSPRLGEQSYRVTSADVLAGIMAHLRRSHDQVLAS